MGKDFGSYGARANALTIVKNIVREYGFSTGEIYAGSQQRQPVQQQPQRNLENFDLNNGFSNPRPQVQQQGFNNGGIRRTPQQGYQQGYPQQMNQPPNNPYGIPNEEWDAFNLNEPDALGEGEVQAEMSYGQDGYKNKEDVDIRQYQGAVDSRPFTNRRN